MSVGMTTTSSLEVEEYCEAVRAALADLPDDVREDLLEDLPDHLREVLVEADGPLGERLGDPAVYADELRAAAGLDPADAVAAETHLLLREFGRRSVELARRVDIRAGRLVGYPRLVDLLRAVQPGWWVLRGWLGAQFLGGVRSRESWHGFVPEAGGSRTGGVALMIAAIAASVWLGRWSLRSAAWTRRAVVVASVVVAASGVATLADSVGGVGGTSDAGSAAYGAPGPDGVSDVYVYDQDGKPVPGARLYDQTGAALTIGSDTCLDGKPAPGAYPTGDPSGYLSGDLSGTGTTPAWTYPLCPTDPGPFRSGPGPVPAR